MKRRNFLATALAIPTIGIVGTAEAAELANAEGATQVEATLGPHDLLVLTVPGAVSEEVAQRLKQTLEEAVQVKGRGALVLSDGLTLAILKRSPS